MNSFKQGEMDIPIPEDALPTYAGALNGMVDVVDGALIELPKEQRLSAALKVVEALATQYGGFQLYVPRLTRSNEYSGTSKYLKSSLVTTTKS